MAQIRGEYKVYKPPYVLILSFFSPRGYIFMDILLSLLVMHSPRKLFRATRMSQRANMTAQNLNV